MTVPEYNITQLHPADIAEIIDQLNLQEGLTLINCLDEEAAADTLEETSDERQVSLIEGMDAERAADILEEMAPDDAADLLGDLPADRAEAILELMEPDESEDIKELLEYPETQPAASSTNEFIAVNKSRPSSRPSERSRKPQNQWNQSIISTSHRTGTISSVSPRFARSYRARVTQARHAHAHRSYYR